MGSEMCIRDRVRVDEEWPQGDSFVAGEPVTRIVTLTALGVVEEQLPDIPEFYPPNFKLYPDQDNTTTVEKDQSLISQRQTSLAIIPTEPGNFVLPEITIPWFNTLTQKTEYATIPARSITVAAASGKDGNNGSAPEPLANSETADDTPTLVNTPVSQERSDDVGEENRDNARETRTEEDTTFLLLTLAIVSALLIVTALGWFLAFRKLKLSLIHI